LSVGIGSRGAMRALRALGSAGPGAGRGAGVYGAV